MFAEGTDCTLPQAIAGRLNRILDTKNRTYLYAGSTSINEGRATAGVVRPGERGRSCTVDGREHGNASLVQVITGRSSLIEYRPDPGDARAARRE